MIPSIIQQIQSSQMHENYKTELIAALKNAENSWKNSRQDFVINKIGDEPQLISGSGGFKNGDEEIIRIPVAVIEYALVRKDLEIRKGSLLREIMKPH